ncbi:MAG: flagellar protein FlgN [Ruminococcus sp.]|jgi:flagellar biosynthesis/type III secretory pathway chaperone|nr:flagellar protein FlgN [Ruminococcus sp.]
MNIDYFAGLRFLEGYAAHFEELEATELRKLRLMHERNPEAVAALIPCEQALVMKTDVLERNRIKLFGNKNLDEVTAGAGALTKDYERLCKRIRNAVEQVKELNEVTGLMAAERLKRAKKANKQLETYNDKGSVSTKYRNNLPDIKV